MAENVRRVPYPGHPERCQATDTPTGDQCMFFKIEDHDFCPVHIRTVLQAARKKEVGLYRIRKYEARLAEFRSATGARTLDEELAMLRIILEEIWNKMEDTKDMLLYSERMSGLISQIRVTVLAAEKLASRTGMLVGRAEALSIAGKVVDILVKHIDNEDLLTKISDDLQAAFLTPLGDIEADKE